MYIYIKNWLQYYLKTHDAPKRSLPTKVLALDSVADHQVAENYNRHRHQSANKNKFIGLSPKNLPTRTYLLFYHKKACLNVCHLFQVVIAQRMKKLIVQNNCDEPIKNQGDWLEKKNALYFSILSIFINIHQLIFVNFYKFSPNLQNLIHFCPYSSLPFYAVLSILNHFIPFQPFLPQIFKTALGTIFIEIGMYPI